VGVTPLRILEWRQSRANLAGPAGIYIQNRVFEWDSKKAVSNKAKHGILFEEASAAIVDPRN
jgi:hypothetical protein